MPEYFEMSEKKSSKMSNIEGYPQIFKICQLFSDMSRYLRIGLIRK